MKLIQFIFGLIFIALDEIVKFFIKRPRISLLLIFIFWVNSLPLPEKYNGSDNSVILLGQNEKSHMNAEYQALIGSGQNKVILAAFRGKVLVNFDLNLEEKTNTLNANFRIFQRDPDERSKNLDLSASIPEDRILAKLYQIKSFGVNVPPEIDLKRARNLPTQPRLEYLRDKTSVKTIREAYRQFGKHLDDDKTKIFLGEFGEKFENNDTYHGFYAYNDNT